MHIRPLYDRIIVRRVESHKQTASGIVIPDTAGEKPEQGEVIAVGNGRLRQDGSIRPLQVHPGERGLFGKFAGQTVKLDDQEVLVLREDDILGVVETARPDALKKAA